MDAGIEDTLNRVDAEKIAQWCDRQAVINMVLGGTGGMHWYNSPWAIQFITAPNEALIPDMTALAQAVGEHEGLSFSDGYPAGANWDAFIDWFRVQITKRRRAYPNLAVGL